MGASYSYLPSFYPNNTRSLNIIEITEGVFDRMKYGLSKNSEDMVNSINAPRSSDESIEKQNKLKTLPVECPSSANYDAVLKYEDEPSTLSKQKEKSDLYQDKLNCNRDILHLKQNLNIDNLLKGECATNNGDLKNNETKNILFGFRRIKPCRELEEKLILCYQQNSGYTLACKNEATAFINCVTAELIGPDDEEDDIPLEKFEAQDVKGD